MPRKPIVQPFTGTSVEVLNAIRNSATTNYQNFVPYAQNDTESIKEIGNIIMQFPALQNEFLNALINRIGRVIITSKLYSNPWAMFKKGLLEFGETVEEIFVNLAEPFQFDPAVAENTVFKRQIPDVRAAFHVMNYQEFYKETISNDQLRQAFLSWQGITDLISKIIESMYTSANYDEFLIFKYLLGKNILNGRLSPVSIGTADAANAPANVTQIKATSNALTFMNQNYNVAGVYSHTPKDNQYLIINTLFDAVWDVNVLASAFNMDKAQFMGHRILVDSFGQLDNPRLAKIFKDNPSYTPISAADLTLLNDVPAVLLDRDYFMVFDNFMNFTEQYNGEGLYWNYWYHTWKTFSVSPFANAIMFTQVTPTVTSVAISPTAVSVPKGQNVQFTATVITTGFAPKAVNWTIDSTISTINASGLLMIPTNEVAGTITVTATSVFDSTKTATATVTVS